MVLSVYTGQFIDGHVQCASGEELKLIVNNVSMKYKNQEMGSNGTLIITTEYYHSKLYKLYVLNLCIDLCIGLFLQVKCVLVIQ